jgi:hypothetical protein
MRTSGRLAMIRRLLSIFRRIIRRFRIEVAAMVDY